ncbi:MAG TPA: DUF4397 domain-containing protein [Flavobacteriaceae bacterium]|nr:DUF4397 domain-containing protein [Flavobacteriaceae bacterium]MCB9213720.1 DUF4397 domain-containing protein [Alteromonas sp.]HPF11908.1 DUF4397 domain-containing protein [Flavobacteriaceae bacterium]HQU21902.1 DUF4397 domain-containing protein [Flavobacteriaceae bacterium]HQU65460.1 DUF4397 domain-containing protein [Flavobacteriaceae bacterium]
MKRTLLPFVFLMFPVLVFSQARVQVIHNSADAAAAEVDVYLDDVLAVDNFAFRTATPFIDFPADVEVVIGIAPPNSSSASDAIATFPVTLMDGETYVVVADGIVSLTGYDPAPPFGLEVYPMGREAATTGTNTDVLVHHGSTDAPTVDVAEVGVGAGTIVDDLAYTDFQGYLELPTNDYTLEIQDASGTTAVAQFSAPLSTLGLDGAALVVVASGFLDPSNNSDGPAFGLWVALPSGGDMVELPPVPLSVQENIRNAFAVYPNPVENTLTIQGLEVGNFGMTVIDMQGRIILTQNNINESFQLDVSSLAQGIYNVTIQVGNQSVVKRFIKR